jgi:esterase
MTKLYSRVRGEGFPVLVLHGLFGSSDNLGGVATALASRYETHAIDLRNHGRSFHDDDMNYSLMAEDVVRYMNENQIEQTIVLGHSMGGKVAMTLALHYPDKVKALIVADISPITYQGGRHDEIFKALFSLYETEIKSRAEADRFISAHIEEPGIRQFLLKNLKPISGGGFELKLNLEAIKDSYEHIMTGQYSDESYFGPVLFIAGAESDYIKMEHKDHTLALFPKAQMKIIPGASHWLHAEKPEMFIRICERFVESVD